MNRIPPIHSDQIKGKTQELLDTIKAKSGRVPNIFKTMAHAPAALQAYLGLSGALAGAVLPHKVREQIALVVAEDNQCHYCLGAHAAIGKQAGLTPEEIQSARQGKASDPKTQAILAFAQKLSAHRGNITDNDYQAVRQAGCSEEEVIEIIAVVALNLFTNYFNHVADPVVDFPQAPPLP